MADTFTWFPFDVEKWFGSVATARMSFAEKGVYAVMLFQQWREVSKTLPDDPEAVADLIAVTPEQRIEVLTAWSAVRRKFVNDRRTPQGRMFNAALERVRRQQRAKSLEKSIAGRIGGKASARRRLEDKKLPTNDRSTTVEHSSTTVNDKRRVEERRVDQIRKEKKRSTPAPAKQRPMFEGQRLTVFPWMRDKLARMLGQHADGFGLENWFWKADERALAEPTVCDDWWAWLQAETKAEAQRRGLPMNGTRASYEWTCPHTPPCLARNACDIKSKLEAARAS